MTGMPGTLGWKAHGVALVMFNGALVLVVVLLALLMYLVMSLLQWGFFQ